jgi:lysophospholipase L1-like esterase
MNPDRSAPVLLKCHPTRRGVIYLGGKTGLLRSDDGGKTFVSLRGGEVWSVSLVPSQPDHLFISGSEGILFSPDSGKTFLPLPAVGIDRQNNKPVRDLAVSPADPKRLACWIPGDNYQWTRYVSHDGGGTFRRVTTTSRNNALPQNARQGYAAWHPTDPNISWNLGGDWVTKSTDGGVTYQWSANGYNGVMLGGLFGFSPHAPGTVFLAFQDYNGAFTTDGGATWNYRDVSGKGWGGYCYGGYAVDANVMWCGDAPDWGGKRTLRISRDGGATWKNAVAGDGKPLQFGGADISFSDPLDRLVLFASNLRSGDKGITWQAMPGCDGVYAYDSRTKALYGKKGGKLVRSQDTGKTWSMVTDCPGGIDDLAVDHQTGRIYAASQERLKVFENGAWSTLETPHDQYDKVRVSTVAVDPKFPSILYVGGPRNLYASHATVCRSTDGGRTWRNLTNTTPLGPGVADSPHEVAAIRVDPVTREAWVNGQCFGMWRIAPPGGDEKGLPAVQASAPRAAVPPLTAPTVRNTGLPDDLPKPAETENPLVASPGYWPDYPRAWNDVHSGFVAKARRDHAKIRIVFLGDSITQGWDKSLWQKHFEPAGAVNFGIGGDGVQQLQWRVEHGELDPLRPKLIVLMIGINNFWGKKGTDDEITTGPAKLVRTLREKQPQPKILLLGILPAVENPKDGTRTRIKAINARYAKLADGKSVRFLDIGPAFLEPDGRISKAVMGDYLHPTAIGYQRYVKAFLPTFEEMRK